MDKQFKRNFSEFENRYTDWEKRKYLTPVYYAQYQVTVPLILEHSGGKFIDLGCGDMPYREIVQNKVDAYDSLDFFPRFNSVTYVGDIQNMPVIPDNTYDSAICIEVLEHVPDPASAIKEIFRILKPGAVVVVTVPHLSRLHDLPHDYYRYTRYGLVYLFEKVGFQIEKLVERGGLFSFLGHQITWVILGFFGGVPVIRNIVFLIIRFGVTLLSWKADEFFQTAKFFPLGYVIVAKKP